MPYLPGILFDMEGNLLEEAMELETSIVEVEATNPQMPSLGDSVAGLLTPPPSSDSPEASQEVKSLSTPVLKTEEAAEGDSSIKESLPKIVDPIPENSNLFPENIDLVPENADIVLENVELVPENADSEDCIVVSTSPKRQRTASLPLSFWSSSRTRSESLKKQKINKVPKHKIESKIGRLLNATIIQDLSCSTYFRELLALFKTIPQSDERIEDLRSLLCKGFLNYKTLDVKNYIVPNLPRDDPDLVVMYSTLTFCVLRGKNGVKKILDEFQSD
ncbi:hypothetical protein TWF506_004372 [Arthrobotrys conoides]|uniref:Uncharacterized protein n=1 Tax=Arthrobotrys conoides TaxID=74498 RepID=A0AAN8N310_9PEZI